MPQEIKEQMPMPDWVLESYGIPMGFIQEVLQSNKR